MNNRFVMMNLLTAVYWFDEALQSALNAAGFKSVSRVQSLLLANVASGEHRAIRLARNLGVSRQSVSQMIAELQARDLLVVESDPDDARAKVVKFSETSSPMRDAARSALEQLEAALEARIGSHRFQAMRSALLAEWGDPPAVDVRREAEPRSRRAGAR